MRLVLKKNDVFLLLIVVLLFQSGLRNVISNNLVDDCCFLTMIVLILINYGCLKKITIPFRNVLKIVLALITLGLIASGIFGLQPISIVITDTYISFRFVGALLCGALMANKCDNAENRLAKISKFVIMILTVLALINIFIYPIFKSYSTRIIPCQQLFFENPAEFSTIVILCMILYIYCNSRNKNIILYLICGSLCVVSTMRSKAIGMVLAIWLIYLLFVKKIIHSKLIVVLIVSTAVYFVGIDTFENYYLNIQQPRAMLLLTSIQIAKDHFPLGAGFGTFGSYASKVSYSSLYSIYGLSGVYGLSRETGSYITDQMWGTVLAQFGFVGTILFILLLIGIYKCIKHYTIYDNNAYAASLLLLIYVIILSLAESSLFNPSALTIFYAFGFFINSQYLLHR